MKKFLTILFLTGLLTAGIAAAENPAKTAGAGRAILGINDDPKEIVVTAVSADGSAIQVEGCTVTELPSGEKTILTATGSKVTLKGAITELNCKGNRLSSLDVRELTALQVLRCGSNRLTSLDVRGLTALQVLYCDNNRLTSLDVRGLTLLRNLRCHTNQLTSLNVQGAAALQELSCDNNRLTSLDVRGLTALRVLSCGDNRLTALDVRRLTALQELHCGSNKIASLDVRGLSALQVLYCDNNRLSSLNVRGLSALQWLICWDNQLTALDVQGLPALQALGVQYNRFEEDSVIRILNALPDRSEEQEGSVVLYAEDEIHPKENGSVVYTIRRILAKGRDTHPKKSGSVVYASAEFRSAFEAAKQKNWKLFMQTEDEEGTEIRLQDE